MVSSTRESPKRFIQPTPGLDLSFPGSRANTPIRVPRLTFIASNLSWTLEMNSTLPARFHTAGDWTLKKGFASWVLQSKAFELLTLCRGCVSLHYSLLVAILENEVPNRNKRARITKSGGNVLRALPKEQLCPPCSLKPSLTIFVRKAMKESLDPD